MREARGRCFRGTNRGHHSHTIGAGGAGGASGASGAYRPRRGRWQVSTTALVVIAAVFLGVFQWLQLHVAFPTANFAMPVEERARSLMVEGMAIIAKAREAAGYPVDPQVDPNRTGLIGVEWSSITTTLGDLQAKRTATNPMWAAYVARRMAEAGVGPGDVVWATFSGSFPGLNLAVLAAAEAVGARLIAVASLGASTWGANLPAFPWVDMEAAVRSAGLFRHGSVAVTLGGSHDKGPDVFALFVGAEDDGVTALQAAAARHPWPLLEPEDVEEAIAMRLDVLSAASGGKQPVLFVNVGGGHASLGNCIDSHTWPAGLTTVPRSCDAGVPGLMHTMSTTGVPVLHLLNVRGLAAGAGIPIDGRFELETGGS